MSGVMPCAGADAATVQRRSRQRSPFPAPPEPEPDDIHVRPGERVPDDAGELLRTFYLPGTGDVRVFARLHPDEMDIQPDQIIERGKLRRSFNLHFRPKGPKEPK